ncbi:MULTISPECIES: hypothetical protein [unclassified Bradyrhizobium]|uniref:hypothetical protein n=1 Tax=Bradyrhizobium TaxID=374 RepID=UPI0028EF2D5D|nr:MULTISPECIES: hypothetical protein [unclassified Bradyrhizobium]
MDLFSFDLVAGAVVGAILLGGTAFVPLARNVALAATNGAIVAAYLRGGIDEILNLADVVQQQMLAHLPFSIGALLGAILVSIIAAQRAHLIQ